MSSTQPEMQTQATPSLPKFLPERYEPIRLLGQGGMGAVYHCMDRQLERPVAIKVMTDKFRASPQSETRFMREARAQAIVNHTNVSTILNFGISAEGKLFLVMEYLEGEDLREMLRREKKLEPLVACELMRQACEGLQEAHACGLVHRDLKPSNLMIIKDHRGHPWVKILDLGLAKMVGGQTDLMTITMDTANQLIGTPAYMSPEQVAGSRVDSRADLYSMGVVFYEMLAGRLPFESETLPGWLYQHLHEMPEPPAFHNPDLEKCPQIAELPMWMLSKKPEERPQTAADVVAALKQILAGKSIGDMLPSGQAKPGSDPQIRPGSNPNNQAVKPGSNSNNQAVTGGSNSSASKDSSYGSNPALKFSSMPAPDRNRPAPPIPGLARRSFSSGGLAPKIGTLPQNMGSRLPGMARPPAGGAAGAALGRFPVSSVQTPLPRTGAPLSNPPISHASSISGLGPEQAAKEFEDSRSEAMSAEAGGQWRHAHKHWLRTQALAEMYGLEQVAARVEACKRQVDFEDMIAKSDAAAKIGDWQTADEILVQLTQPQELDARLEQAKASLPRRMVSAWMELAAQKIRALPEGDFRRDLVERYTIVCASSGDMSSAINFLDASPRRAELRIIACAQAVSAAIRHGHTEGMRPYLERLENDLKSVENAAERGKACLEVGRAFAVYGDLENAADCLRDAFKFFSEAHAKGIPVTISERALGSETRFLRQTPTASVLLSGKTLSGSKSIRSSWLTAVSALADAQAEAGLIDDCLKSAMAIDDPWTKALVMSQLVQNFTKAGRHELAERQAATITFALPKTQALRAIAISKIYREDVIGAEELLAAIPTPAERLPIYGCLAVYHALRKDPAKPRTLIANLLSASKQIHGALPRFNALAAAAEPILGAGFNDMARSVFEEAQQMIPQVDEPAERLRCLLHLVKLKEQRRDVTTSTTRTVAFAGRPATHLVDMLRQALFTARQLRNGTERVDCLERIATRVAAASLPMLATEMFNTFREDQEQASTYIGLCAGLV